MRTRMQARRWHVRDQMNGLEQRYAAHLAGLKAIGEVLEWRFEAITLRLTKALRYTPDFWVVMPDGRVELHEVKGHWEDDARVKVKAAAEIFYEFAFVGVRWDKREGWCEERFGGA